MASAVMNPVNECIPCRLKKLLLTPMMAVDIQQPCFALLLGDMIKESVKSAGTETKSASNMSCSISVNNSKDELQENTS